MISYILRSYVEACLYTHFNSNTSHTDLRKYTTFKLVKQLNPIGSMKTFTKPN